MGSCQSVPSDGKAKSVVSSKEWTCDDIEAAWKVANKQAAENKKALLPVIRRANWRTVRIFVSSTFKDFDSEREVLVKKVFPDLRAWCWARRLHLYECDLRWGIPLSKDSEITPIRTCLNEIDRCIAENVVPFFISMVSDRVGWIPQGDHLPEGLKEEYQWVNGFSITEMEIMHAAYRTENPNALFMIRDPSYIETVPVEHRSLYVEETPISKEKLSLLKKMIEKRFTKGSKSPVAKKNIFRYKCRFDGVDEVTNWPRLSELDDFAKIVFDFFQKQISDQYPLIESTKLTPIEDDHNQQEAFMKLQADAVVGRESFINKMVDKYVNAMGRKNCRPVVVIGGSGVGKASAMCALAKTCLARVEAGKLKHVFFHTAGALPESADLLQMLQRLMVETGIVAKDAKLPSDVDEAVGLVRGALSKESLENVVIVVDGIYRFDDSGDHAAAPFAWLPSVFPPNIQIFLSATPDSSLVRHIERGGFGAEWDVIQLPPLDKKAKESLVTSYLSRYNKVLDKNQMNLLLVKQSSNNPMWLTLSTNELRIFGQFRQLNEKIKLLPDGLFDLEEEILARFERESDVVLLVATLCLLECAVDGLLESELVELLARPNLLPPQLIELLKSYGHNNVENKPVNPGISRRRGSNRNRITASRWADILRVSRLFLRPFGSASEGLLDFVHLSIKTAVQKRYFTDQENAISCPIRQWFCRHLADYFGENDRAAMNRRIREYPPAARTCKDSEGLVKFLSNWNVFDAMYDSVFSRHLSKAWAFVGNIREKDTNDLYTPMEECYINALENKKASNDKVSLPERLERIARVLMQNRRCAAAARVADRLLAMSQPASAALAHTGYLFLKAMIVDEDLRYQDFLLRIHEPGYDPKSPLPRMDELITCFEATISGFRHHAPKDARLGQCLNAAGFTYSGVSMRGGYGELTIEKAKELAIERVEEALTLYGSLNGNNYQKDVADCLITRGICEGQATAEQLKLYLKSQNMIISHFGSFHPLLLRAYFNIAIHFREKTDHQKANEYFKKWYNLLIDLFGTHHPRTQNAESLLRKLKCQETTA